MSENTFAPAGWVWQCLACGKRSRDRYGFERLDRGYDAACTLNAKLVRADVGAARSGVAR